MKRTLSTKIISVLVKAGKQGASQVRLREVCGIKRKQQPILKKELAKLERENVIVQLDRRYYLPKVLGLYRAVILQNHTRFCFAQKPKADTKIFIPGRYSGGAIVGDEVLLSAIQSKGDSPEARVVSFVSYGDSLFTGILQKQRDGYVVLPDTLCNTPIAVRDLRSQAALGDKVVAQVVTRGNRHDAHICDVIRSHGSAESAAACCSALLEAEQVRIDFSSEVLENAKAVQKESISTQGRLDLRDLPVFTIDSAESKDLDDAVSIEKTKTGYNVGVHIADVSHYVKPQSALDQEAFLRGCSVYYADRVIPMLPRELSNGICSLNPREDRLCLSALLTLDHDCELVEFQFAKTVIHSRVKGVYREMNAILAQQADGALLEKYKEVLPSLQTMVDVYQVRKEKKEKRGAPKLETSESYIIMDESGMAVDVKPRKTGKSEGLIEELMLLGNEAAATFAKQNELPFVYRVHEPPTLEKLENLKKLLEHLGLPTGKIKPNIKPKVLAELLEQSKNSPSFAIVNMQVLRSMSKARYDAKPLGHYALVLPNYAHFTSPIRRYPDLVIHRIISEFLLNNSANLKQRYQKFVSAAALQSSNAERKAIQIERECESRYMAEYMRTQIGETFDGIITGMVKRGLFVALPNTVEGFVSVETLDPDFTFDEYTKLNNTRTGKMYQIGQSIKVQCDAVNVNEGQIDFSII